MAKTRCSSKERVFPCIRGLQDLRLASRRALAPLKRISRQVSLILKYCSPDYLTVRYSFNGWGLTMVDSLDTMLIMGLNKEFEESIPRIAETRFDQVHFNLND
jgi:hypothetical protein